MNGNEAKFLFKINYAVSFNTTPILKMYFNKNIANNNNC